MTGKKGLRSAIGVVGLIAALAALTLTVVWAQESQTVGTDGGTLSFDDGNVMVSVPQGAAGGDTMITYTAIAEEDAPAMAPEGTDFGSRIFMLSVDPDQALANLAEITVAYTADDIAAAAGGRADNVNLYIYDPAFGAWNKNEAAVRDYVNNTLTSSQRDLGVTMAIVITPPPPVQAERHQSFDGVMVDLGEAPVYDVTISHAAVDAPAMAPEGMALGSSVFMLSVEADDTVGGHLTVSYTEDDLAAAGGMYANVSLVAYDADSESWMDTGAERDMENMTLTANRMDLAGTYAVVTMMSPDVPATGDIAPGTSLLAGIAVLGALLTLGGGYLYIRGRRASEA